MAAAASFFNKNFKFGVVYDDDSFGNEAKQTKKFVKYMVEGLEKKLKDASPDAQEANWKGYYTARDGLPGENKMTRYVTLARKCEFLICVITNNFATKGISVFRSQMTQYVQQVQDKEAIIPVVYGITQERARDALGAEGNLATMMLYTPIHVEEDYTKDSDDWLERISDSLAEGENSWEADIKD